MDFLIKHIDRFRLTAIFSTLSFNFFLIYASWSCDNAAWYTAYIIAGIAIITSLVCHITKDYKQPKYSNR